MFSHARRLSWSGHKSGLEVDLSAINDPSVEIGVPGGNTLLDLVDAVLKGSEADIIAARRMVIEQLGPEAFVDAAAVFGNFEMMNRVAEGTGVPVAPQALEREAEMVQSLGLDRVIKNQQS